ncbi:nuclear transport factor 2 family protein [Chryseobacterium sp. MA9]|uniref:nuclear transport factor 2 family protein n=1 Tax=Chryseobacterium sp. MA9 TaxID=2966625 RepID=UPI0021078B42|nr:nuclear transport factor 2 family protein [Chryseobacterium sp. MA9]UTX49112.1 nuclear transport factor 2 family protein [Chryseobacterium sp. MA9]
MSTENLKIKEELRNLIDAYATLGDEKKIAEQMHLFTENVSYKAYMGNFLAADISGREAIEKEFNMHAALVKTYFTLNGQHIVEIDGGKAHGISFSQIKMIREKDGKDSISDYSVKYKDNYVLQDDKWLISERTGYFIIVEERAFGS